MSPRRWRLALFVSATTAVAACGAADQTAPGPASTTPGGTSSATTSAPAPTPATELPVVGPKACDLIDVAEIMPLLAAPVQQWHGPQPSSVGPGVIDHCFFARQDQTFFGPAVQVSTFPPGSSVDKAKSLLRDVEPLDGMDGDAFIGTLATAPAGTPPTTVGVVTDYGIYGISTYPPTTISRENLIDLARKAGVRYRAAVPR